MSRRLTIAEQIVLLVFGAVLLSMVVLFAITFAGPPPKSAPVAIGDLRALLVDAVPLPPNAEPAVVTERLSPPDALPDLRRLPMAERALAGSKAIVWGEPGGAMTGRELRGHYLAAVRLSDGRWRVATPRPEPWLTAWHRTTLASTLAMVLIMGGLAWALARTITRPLKRLSQSVVSVHTGGDPPQVLVEGPPEVRRLARALNTLGDRVAATLASRTEALAAITHDLATPLSRLAFRVEGLDEPARGRAQDDITEMRVLIASVLEFARGEVEPRTPVALVAVLEELIRDAVEAGHPVRLRLRGVSGQPQVLGTPTSLRRLFDNLIGNALRFASDVEVGVTCDADCIVVTVIDNGPGLPAHLGERLFEPFVRGEGSRNRETGGAGLGLAIARSIAEGAGGTLTGRTRDEGGAVFAISLPLAGN